MIWPFRKKRLVAVIPVQYLYTDLNETVDMTYYLYERGSKRSFESIGFTYNFQIEQHKMFQRIIRPWLDGGGKIPEKYLIKND